MFISSSRELTCAQSDLGAKPHTTHHCHVTCVRMQFLSRFTPHFHCLFITFVWFMLQGINPLGKEEDITIQGNSGFIYLWTMLVASLGILR